MSTRIHPKNVHKNSPKEKNSRGQKMSMRSHQKCPQEFTVKKCPLEFAHFEKKCPQEFIVSIPLGYFKRYMKEPVSQLLEYSCQTTGTTLLLEFNSIMGSSWYYFTCHTVHSYWIAPIIYNVSNVGTSEEWFLFIAPHWSFQFL